VRRCGDTLTVSLEYSMPVTIGLLQPLLGNQISLGSQIKMRLLPKSMVRNGGVPDENFPASFPRQ
jgi:hypothetical protein